MRVFGNGTIFNWGPLIAIGLISFISYATVLVHPVTVLFPGAWLLFLAWALVVVAIVISFLASIYVGPGYVKLKWEPPNPDNLKKVQWCKHCHGYKAPRSHHCKDCGRCVKMLDHHCPWINNCVGNDNKVYFIAFTTSVPIGCLYSASVLGTFLWRYWPLLLRSRRNMPSREFLDSLPRIVFANQGLFNGGVQCHSVIKNKTGIENWILKKARHRRGADNPFKYPFDMGWWQNIKNAVDQSLNGDGIHWPVLDGTSPYDLTAEQVAQKAVKHNSRSTMRGEQDTGFLAWRAGFMTMLRCPWESHIRVRPGATYQVWRGNSLWWYGEAVEVLDNGVCTSSTPLERGWFPKTAVSEAEQQLRYVEDRDAQLTCYRQTSTSLTMKSKKREGKKN
ncbi:uncharacterized protein MONBRDRAFT_27359 [Monosiga brevicollis MX1]|uniref:Palmitoyltransferase n=1 Tax=Monosiga brevicollis TaxID=81824 RepID=A9V523_MONBE|nr:uncharacterized protein MONBRDRAFT_27359 [Monosiga brevicollis MX1]EDQ87199.1 predicted protein [Monosiga brevicollis MX1]|eukprot:XP_001747812.1 hypothetical protein [Monosiga brevicollis MX1]